MTDAQLITLALAIIIPLSMLLYSNSITEAKETLRAEMAEMRVEMRAGFHRVETAIATLETNLGHKLQVHELEHHK